jgi:prophage regulatory protein
MTDQRHESNTFILAQELTGLVPFSPNHLRRLEAQGDFPRRIRIGANRIAWLRDEVEQWLAVRMEAR